MQQAFGRCERAGGPRSPVGAVGLRWETYGRGQWLDFFHIVLVAGP